MAPLYTCGMSSALRPGRPGGASLWLSLSLVPAAESDRGRDNIVRTGVWTPGHGRGQTLCPVTAVSHCLFGCNSLKPWSLIHWVLKVSLNSNDSLTQIPDGLSDNSLLPVAPHNRPDVVSSSGRYIVWSDTFLNLGGTGGGVRGGRDNGLEINTLLYSLLWSILLIISIPFPCFLLKQCYLGQRI